MTTSIISEEKLIRRPFEWNSIVLSGLEELGSELWPAKKEFHGNNERRGLGKRIDAAFDWPPSYSSRRDLLAPTESNRVD